MNTQKITALPIRGLLTIGLATSTTLLATSAQAFNFSSVGTWSNPVGNVATVNYQTVGSDNQVRWGDPIGPEKSGLGFTGNNGTANFGDTIALGLLSSFNRTIAGGTGISGVDLKLNLGFGGTLPIPNQNFTFKLAIDETPNAAPCAYPGETVCSDRISFTNTTSSNIFSVGGTDYTLQLLGFSSAPGGTPINEFFSEEDGANRTQLYGRVVESAAVPEPTTMAGLALAGGGLAAMRRRRKAQG